MANRAPIVQPKFDHRISTLVYPLMGGRAPGKGVLQRGYMIWEKPLVGYNGLARMHFLYNPSVVEADYPLSDSSVGAILQFPNPGDKADLAVPLYQTVTWSVLFDRTYELWGSYDKNGNPNEPIGKDQNNPAVVGVLADIIQMQQFTGMMVSFSSGGQPTTGAANQSFTGHQGIVQIVPSYVYFGPKNSLGFYGYISEWDVQVTHWNMWMIPMRCVINITFTMLPPISKVRPGTSSDNNWVTSKLHTLSGPTGSSGINVPTTGVSGR